MPLYEFQPSFTVDQTDLTLTSTGSGVHLNKAVTVDLDILDRTSGSVLNNTEFLANSYVSGVSVDILNLDGSVEYQDFLTDYKSNVFTFTEYDNINVFGQYAKDFGIKITLSETGQSYTSEFYFYGNVPEISGIEVQDSTGTTSHSSSESSKTAVNSTGQTGALTSVVTFNNDIGYTSFDRIEVYSSSSSDEFASQINPNPVFSRSITNQSVQVFDINEGALPNGSPVYLHYVPYGNLGTGAAWTVGPYTFEDNPIATNQYITKDDTGDFGGNQDLSGVLTNGNSAELGFIVGASEITGDLTVGGDIITDSDTTIGACGEVLNLKGDFVTLQYCPGISSAETPQTFLQISSSEQVEFYRQGNFSEGYTVPAGKDITIGNAVMQGDSDQSKSAIKYAADNISFSVSGTIDGSSSEFNQSNEINSFASAILLGTKNKIFGDYSTIVAGTENIISGEESDSDTSLNSDFDFIGAGSGNQITGSRYSSIVGGIGNNILKTSDNSFIGGGTGNVLEGSRNSVIGGGVNNYINSAESVQIFGSYITGTNIYNGYIYLADNQNRTKTPDASDTLFIDFEGGVDIKTGDLTVVDNITMGGDTVATQDWVTGQGYITSETDDQTLDEVLTQGNVSASGITVGSSTISGDLDVSGALAVTNDDTGVSDIFSVDGVNGRLFGVTDEVTGTVFSVNDAAGLPIVEVESTSGYDKIIIGEYGSDALVISGTNSALFNVDVDITGGLDVTGDITMAGNTVLTGITSGDITGALGYTPLSSETDDQSLQEILNSGNSATGTINVDVFSGVSGVFDHLSTSGQLDFSDNGSFISAESRAGSYRNPIAFGLTYNGDDPVTGIEFTREQNAGTKPIIRFPNSDGKIIGVEQINFSNHAYISANSTWIPAMNGYDGVEFNNTALSTTPVKFSWQNSRVTFDSSLDVGIGVASPSYPLDVAGNIGLDGDNRHIYFGGANTFIGENSNSNKLELRGGGNNTAKTVFIDNDGRLGIGDSTPSYKLDVNGTGRFVGDLYVDADLDVTGDITMGGETVLTGITSGDITGALGYTPLSSETDDQTLDEVLTQGNTSSQEITVGGATINGDLDITGDAAITGNVGIGTTSPSSPLHIDGGTTSEVLKIEADDNPYLRFVENGTNKGYIQYTSNSAYIQNDNAAGALYIRMGSTNTATFKGDGDFLVDTDTLYVDAANNRVGIGTDIPSQKLDVRGDTFISGQAKISKNGVSNTVFLDLSSPPTVGANVNFIFEIADTHIAGLATKNLLLRGSSSSSDIVFSPSTTSKGLFTLKGGNGGRVGIHDTSPSYELDVNGTGHFAYDLYVDADLDVTGDITMGGETVLTGITSGDITGALGYTPLSSETDDQTLDEVLTQGNTSSQEITVGGATINGDIDVTGDAAITGNVGIGTTSPAQKLHINGGIARFSNTASNWIEIDGSVSGNNTAQISSRFNRFDIKTNTGAGAPHISLLPATGGNVGIGTTSPSVKLDVAGDINTSGSVTTEGPDGGMVMRTWTGSSGFAMIGTANMTGNEYSLLTDGNNTFLSAATGGYVVIRGGNNDTSPNIKVTTTNIELIGIPNKTSEATALVIDGSSNVGYRELGSNAFNSTSYLPLAGGTMSGAIAMGSQNITGGGSFFANLFSVGNEGKVVSTSTLGLQLQATGSQKPIIFSTNDGGMTERMRVHTDGNVGIGTTSPNEKLEVDGNIRLTDFADDIQFGSTANMLSYNQWLASASGGMIIKNAASASTGHIAFETSSGEKVRILRDGSVGIGTTSPSDKLEVYANGADVALRIHEDAGTHQARLHLRRGGSDWEIINDNHLTIEGEGTERMRITTSGNVGIGTTSPSAKLEVNGHFAATTKSFIVDNPKTGGKLQYGVVESDQHSVFVRGKNDTNLIELPEEWEWLVDPDSVTVQLTSIGQIQQLFVISQDNKKIKIGGLATSGQYNYTVYGERVDVDKLQKHLK